MHCCKSDNIICPYYLADYVYTYTIAPSKPVITSYSIHYTKLYDEVKAPDRIDAVIQRLRRKALDLDLSPNLVADLYKLMIDEMVETEIAELRNAKDL